MLFRNNFRKKQKNYLKNNGQDTKKKNRARHRESKIISYLRNLKKEENNVKQIYEERLRVSTENQFQLNGRLITDHREQMWRVWTVDSVDNMPQQQKKFIVQQLQVQQNSQNRKFIGFFKVKKLIVKNYYLFKKGLF